MSPENHSMVDDIAIVGLACRYPDASSPYELWENTLAQRRAFRRLPPERLNLNDYFSADINAPDRIYITEAAVIEGYAFDRVKFQVPGKTFRSTDMTHWMALDIASQALEDAGFPNAEGIPLDATGVLVGNTLTGEFSRASLMRLRWPYVRRVTDNQLREEGWDSSRRRVFLEQMEVLYKKPFEPINEESLAGGLSNTIAGRICNYFNLGGGGYTVDGACSSSLLAVTNACSALVSGDLEVAIAGGVDLSLDPFELVGFCKTGALTKGDMRVYDRKSSGFLPGEGCGFMVLMRYQDALARNLRCHALIRGWGISSDGGGGITRPEVDGQCLAVSRAYQRAAYSIGTVSLFEGHGTGTAVGDSVELRTLVKLRSQSNATQRAAVGSIKANIGHCKAAAGIAGLIKATMAIRTKVVPPNTGVDQPHPELEADTSMLRVLTTSEPWPENQPLRAGVSSFGFGGINVHIALENPEPVCRYKLSTSTKRLSNVQEAELFLLSGQTHAELLCMLEQLIEIGTRLSYAELADLAATLTSKSRIGEFRAAVVASTPSKLTSGLQNLRLWLNAGETEHLDCDAGIFLAIAKVKPRIAFLFPGQASPVRFNGGAMGKRFASIEQFYQSMKLDYGDVKSTAIAQPAIVAAEVAGLHLLDSFGINASVVLGHSLGELTALHWAGALNEKMLINLAKMRGKVMSMTTSEASAMASIAEAPEDVLTLLNEQKNVTIACFNGPEQTVISGESTCIEQVMDRARASGKKVTLLDVSSGFHSILMAPISDVFADNLTEQTFVAPKGKVISTVSGVELTSDIDLKELLKRQFTEPVQFTDAAKIAIDDADLFIEVGPGKILTELMKVQTNKPLLSLDVGGSSLNGLLHTIAATYVLGTPVDTQALFNDRLIRQFDLNWQPCFLVNPCELAPTLEDDNQNIGQSAEKYKTEFDVQITIPSLFDDDLINVDTTSDIEAFIRKLIAERAELPIEAIKLDSHMLVDLHLNSITVSEVVTEAAHKLCLPQLASPTDFADATVAQLAQGLQEMLDRGLTATEEKELYPKGVDSWVRAYEVNLVAEPLINKNRILNGPSVWQVLAPKQHLLAESLRESLLELGGCGVIVCLPPDPDETCIASMLQGVKAVLKNHIKQQYFVLVQHGGGAASLAKTFFLETKDIITRIVDVPYDRHSLDWILAEIQSIVSFAEVYYDNSGKRFVPHLSILPLAEKHQNEILGPTDVLLVSGGGKGIAAESALTLAKETGVKLILLGRSDPAKDEELANNLRRMTNQKISFRYYSADVTDAGHVKEVVSKAQSELGTVTALLHGAGINQPALLQNQNEEKFQQTIAAKVTGAKNMLDALDQSQLRLLVTFSSIIGRCGLRGEADYALANEWLTRLTERFQMQYPACKCLALEWSIWSGAGMGERLGRVDALLQEGITPISVDDGVKMLLQLIRHPLATVAVPVIGRIGDLPTVRFADKQLPFWRYLEQPKIHYPGVELVVDVELSIASDPYLDDHVFNGNRLFPAVMGMEAMAEVAMTLLNEKTPPQFEDIEFKRPIVVNETKSETIRIAAIMRSPVLVEVVLRCSQTNFMVDHFNAMCSFVKQEKVLDTVSNAIEDDIIEVDPLQDMYGSLFFHSGRFCRIDAYRQLHARCCIAEISPSAEKSWFAKYLPDELVLGDPGVRDAAIHAIQACIPQSVLLPTSVEKIVFEDLEAKGPWMVSAHEQWQDDNIYCYDLEVSNREGVVRERWQGLHLQRVSVGVSSDWLPALLGPYLQRELETRLGVTNIKVTMDRNNSDSRQDHSNRLLRRILDVEVVIQRRPDGKPVCSDGHKVSTAHSGNITLAIAGKDQLSCDLEPVVKRSTQTWVNLLGAERNDLVAHILQSTKEDSNVVATRVWAAQECLRKIGASIDMPLTLLSSSNDQWMLFSAGQLCICSYVADLKNHKEPLVIAILVVVKASVSRENKTHVSKSINNEIANKYEVI